MSNAAAPLGVRDDRLPAGSKRQEVILVLLRAELAALRIRLPLSLHQVAHSLPQFLVVDVDHGSMM